MKTLQDQYKLIKEGKGHKDVFLKEAKQMFPNYIRNAATFEEASNILKDKNIISENLVGLEPINTISRKKESYETAFENFLEEARKKNDNDPNAEIKKVSQQVEDKLKHNFDRTDKKNPDNQIFGEIMKGYYCEMKDPKNADKTEEQLRDIVLKNLAKDPIYYTKNGMFGEKGVGVEMDVPGLGEPKEPKGKYKSSGYGDLKEGKIKRNYPNFLDSEYQGETIPMTGDELYTFLVDTMAISRNVDDFIQKVTYGLTDETSTLSSENEEKLRNWWDKNYNMNESINESKLRKVIRESIEKELAAINKEAELEVLSSKLEKIEAAIEKRNSQLSKLNEDEDMKALMDKKKIKSLEKDIKTLEKAKAKIEKQLSKVAKKNKGANVAKKEIIDEDEIIDEGETQDTLDASEKTPNDISGKKTFNDFYEEAEKEMGLPRGANNQGAHDLAYMRWKQYKEDNNIQEVEDEIIEKEINEGPKEDSSSGIRDNWEEIKKIVDDIEKTDLFEEDENGLSQEIINQIVPMYAETGGDTSKIEDIASEFPEMYDEVVEFLEGYDLGNDYDI